MIMVVVCFETLDSLEFFCEKLRQLVSQRRDILGHFAVRTTSKALLTFRFVFLEKAI